MHPSYKRLVEKAQLSHEKNRSPEGITPEDISLARLYCYGFRLHTIGTFHATRLAIQGRPPAGPLSTVCRARAVEVLEDLADQAMEPVPTDFRVVISTLHRYDSGVRRVIESLRQDHADSGDPGLADIAGFFQEAVGQISAGNGIHLTRDTDAPRQASFVVPNLGITIVPLVYGDHHSWNLAYLAGDTRNVPTHLHHYGVEIHLGYNPTRGMTVLGRRRADVAEGYAMPVPPETAHGWVNTGMDIHHVPFIFGSLRHGGWGVFLDVEAQTRPVEELEIVCRDNPAFGQMVYLEREIERAEAMASSWRKTLIPFAATNRQGAGGLELSLTRANPAGYAFPVDCFRIVSVVRGRGVVTIEGIEREVAPHDHFGVPAGMRASLRQAGPDAMVALDALIQGF